jgi:hypothetical protein
LEIARATEAAAGPLARKTVGNAPTPAPINVPHAAGCDGSPSNTRALSPIFPPTTLPAPTFFMSSLISSGAGKGGGHFPSSRRVDLSTRSSPPARRIAACSEGEKYFILAGSCARLRKPSGVIFPDGSATPSRISPFFACAAGIFLVRSASAKSSGSLSPTLAIRARPHRAGHSNTWSDAACADPVGEAGACRPSLQKHPNGRDPWATNPGLALRRGLVRADHLAD